ncbi:MAG: hypothetical protein ACOYL6_18010 [Bacteriovoracaceae bacterium]
MKHTFILLLILNSFPVMATENSSVADEASSIETLSINDDYKWTCMVRRNKYGAEVVGYGRKRKIAKRAAYYNCDPRYFHCIFLGCEKNN